MSCLLCNHCNHNQSPAREVIWKTSRLRERLHFSDITCLNPGNLGMAKVVNFLVLFCRLVLNGSSAGLAPPVPVQR